MTMTHSPWFKPNDLPVRVGSYQVQDTAGRITDAWWDGVKFHIPCAVIFYAWRGVVK